MTNREFSNEFDIQYNAIATSSAPGIDVYEKSVYLTKAQLEIVKNYYNPKGNKYQEGFESSEKRRRDLVQLVEPFIATSFDNFISNNSGGFEIQNIKINPKSKFVKIPNDTFLIIYESLIGKPEYCESREIKIKPITHDEYSHQIKNPFRQPYESVAWRFDLRNIQNNKVVEILSEIPITEYRMRYIKYPKPIILADLDEGFPNEELTIEGISEETPCALNESLHPEILDRAVELALRDYKPQNLESKMQLDLRNE